MRRLVFLGGPAGAEPLLHDGAPLLPAVEIPLVRKRSPWNPARDVERVIVGSHAGRADVRLEGKGIRPEHVRIYLPRDEAQPVDLLAIHPGSTRAAGRAVEPRDWSRLAGGEEIELGPWRFRYERS
jgi:hypothetical protein